MVKRIGEGRRTRGRVPVGRVEAGGLHVYINAGGSGAISPNHSKPESERDKKKKGAGGGQLAGGLDRASS